MDKIIWAVGSVVMGAGGFMLAAALLLFLGWLVQVAWVIFSDQFRAICKAESMIFEYRRYREEFLKWRESANEKIR